MIFRESITIHAEELVRGEEDILHIKHMLLTQIIDEYIRPILESHSEITQYDDFKANVKQFTLTTYLERGQNEKTYFT